MNIRKSTIEDIEEVVALRLCLWEFEKSIADFAIKEPEVSAVRDEVAQLYSSEDNRVFVVEDEGSIVGFVYGSIEKSATYLADYTLTGNVRATFLEQAYRGRGLGNELLQSLLEWFSFRNVEFIQLGVLTANSGAIELYEKNGFEVYYYKMKKITPRM